MKKANIYIKELPEGSIPLGALGLGDFFRFGDSDIAHLILEFLYDEHGLVDAALYKRLDDGSTGRTGLMKQSVHRLLLTDAQFEVEGR